MDGPLVGVSNHSLSLMPVCHLHDAAHHMIKQQQEYCDVLD